MVEKSFTITSETGIHARPATVLIQAAGRFSSDINLQFNGKKVNLKSIMGVMALGIKKGSTVTISAEGHDADEAIEQITEVMKKEELGE